MSAPAEKEGPSPVYCFSVAVRLIVVNCNKINQKATSQDDYARFLFQSRYIIENFSDLRDHMFVEGVVHIRSSKSNLILLFSFCFGFFKR